MEISLPKNKIISTYKRYSLPVATIEPTEIKKLEFFYIGKQARYVEKLMGFFEFGYSTASPDHAIITLRRLLSKTDDVTIPDAIIMEAGLGIGKIVEFHRFISEYKILADMPFIVEGTGLSRADMVEWKRYNFIDEILFLTEFAGAEVGQKVKFIKRVKQQYTHQPASCVVEKSAHLFTDVPSLFKRVLDIAITASLLFALIPVLALIAIAIKLDAGGPVLQLSRRIGRGYRPFDLLKFETTVESEDGGTDLSRVGLFLRKTGLDDLPQLLNVLIGDLSLVGSRPLTPSEAVKLTTDKNSKRFLKPAGITGLWQFKKEKEIEVEEIEVVEGTFTDQPDMMYDLWAMANRQHGMIGKSNA